MRSRNFSSDIVLVTAPVTPDTAFTVAHGLGTTPRGAFIVQRSHAARLYRPYTVSGGAGLATDFIAGWEFENGASLGDDSGTNALTLTNSGATQVAGKVGNAADLVAVSTQYLTRTSESLLQAGDIDFTFALWANLTSKPAGSSIAVSKDNSGVAGGREYLIFHQATGDRMRFQVFKAVDSAMFVDANTFGSPPLTTWFLVVCWHDATANTVNIQVNNGAVDSTATTGALQAASASDFYLGRRQGATPLYWDGKVDQVMFWKRTLSTAERTSVYNGGSGLTVAQALASSVLTPASWTDTEVTLACDTASAQFYVLFFI